MTSTTSHEWGGPNDPFHELSQPIQPHPADQSQPGAAPPRPGVPRRALLGAGAVVVAGAAVAGWAATRPDPAPNQPSVSAAPALALQRPAPPGWDAKPAWKSDIHIASGVAVKGKQLAAITTDRTLVLLDAATGKKVFTSTPQPTLSTSARVLLSEASGVPVAGIVDGSSLMLWNATKPGADPEVLTLTPGAAVTTSGGGLLVASGERGWIITSKLKLGAVRVPAKHKPLTADAKGNVITAPVSGPAHLATRAAPRKLPVPKSPGGTVGPVHVAWAAHDVLGVWWSPQKGPKRIAGLVDAPSGKVLASAPVDASDVDLGLPLVVASDRSRAAMGPLVAELKTGTSKVFPGFLPMAADTQHVFGSLDGAQLAVTPKKENTMKAATAIPWGVSSNGIAVVLDRDGSRVVPVGLHAA